MNAQHCPILLVEDDPDHALLIQRALRKANLLNAVHLVTDGEAAIEYLDGRDLYADRRRHPMPVFVLLDLKLPRRSGLDVLAWLRAHPHLRRLPVVVLTSSRESSDVNRAYDLGANSYLVKPVDFDALHGMMHQLNLYWLVLNELPEVESEP